MWRATVHQGDADYYVRRRLVGDRWGFEIAHAVSGTNAMSAVSKIVDASLKVHELAERFVITTDFTRVPLAVGDGVSISPAFVKLQSKFGPLEVVCTVVCPCEAVAELVQKTVQLAARAKEST